MGAESSVNPLRNQSPLTTFSRNLRKKEVFPYVGPRRSSCVFPLTCGGWFGVVVVARGGCAWLFCMTLHLHSRQRW